MRTLLGSVALVLSAATVSGRLFAVEIRGTVAVGTQNQDVVRITADSDSLPNIGDPAEIFIEIPGLEGRAIVASGRVSGFEGVWCSSKSSGPMRKSKHLSVDLQRLFRRGRFCTR
jgi:hypothetical protein